MMGIGQAFDRLKEYFLTIQRYQNTDDTFTSEYGEAYLRTVFNISYGYYGSDRKFIDGLIINDTTFISQSYCELYKMWR